MQSTMDVDDLTGEVPEMLRLTSSDLAALAEELTAYHARFAPLFQRREQRRWAGVYLRGLLLTDVPRKNVEAMALRVLGAGPAAARQVRGLQQFVSEGAWDDEAILAAHQRWVDETIGEDDGVLIIDGSDVPKQGGHSVGVARQWCGASGKTENCQPGVYLGYASRRGYTLIDRRLYLHASWFADDHRARWQACAIPDDVRFRTKLELAAKMVEEIQQHQRVRAQWLVCDEGYGQDPALLDRVAATGLWYLAEVPGLPMVWPRQDPATGKERPHPQLWIPPRHPGRRGRSFTKERLHPDTLPPVRVDTLPVQLPDHAWHRYRILEGSKGPLVADFAAVRALTSRHGLPGPEVWVLFRRPVGQPDSKREVKIYLSNAPADTPLAQLVRVSGMRWPIESCFQEGKSEVGLDQYELRSWRGWHHHMTLVILAHHFLVRLQQRLDPRGGEPTASDQRDHRSGGLPGRRAAGGPGPLTPLATPPHPVVASGPLVAPRRVAVAYPRRDTGPGLGGLHPVPQPGRLPLPSQAHAPAPCSAQSLTKSRCHTSGRERRGQAARPWPE